MIGNTLAQYEITSQLGKGGMGEVYLADDITLDRKVALKFLPGEFTNDPERMARFEREAKLLASLNHPNIAGIFGLEQADGNRFLVLEYVEGETLQARLIKGALSLEDALELCRQIAEGLEAAHEKGVIHRDLKPANVMITAEEKVKILDFGLAKALEDEIQSSDPLDSPTITDAMTRPGVILGTAAYMSPEQAKGKSVDKRTDIWAFGCILYECLTGKRAFEGEVVTETLAAVIKDEPDFEKIPARIRPTLRQCLSKDKKKRFRDIGDVALLIRSVPELVPDSGTVIHRRLSWIWPSISTLFAVVLIILSFLYFNGRKESKAEFYHLSVPPMPSGYGYAISPDDQRIAFVASSPESVASLYVCEIGSVKPERMKGTEGASLPFWSPDAQTVAFFAEGWLKAVNISSGSPQKICRLTGIGGGGSWNKDGDILFSDQGNLRLISSREGGEPATIANPNENKAQASYYYCPYFLPDGRHFLTTSLFATESEKKGVYLGSIDSNEMIWLLDAYHMAAYVDGCLIFIRDRTLFARPFDWKNKKLTGDAVIIAENLITSANGVFFSVSNQRLVYRAGDAQSQTQFYWLDRNGTRISSVGKPGLYSDDFDLSPDGKKIAFTKADPITNVANIWVNEWERDIPEQFTFGSTDNIGPVWSGDGLNISYVSKRNGNIDIFQKASNGTGEEIVIADSPNDEWLDDLSRDGSYVAYTGVEESSIDTDIHIIPLSGDGKSRPIVQRASRQDEPHFSHNGKWLAYDSNESGIWQVYVVSVPSGLNRRLISTNGGAQPRWKEDDRELYYLSMDGKMMAVDISAEATIDSGRPKELFNTGLIVDPTNDQYDVTADGECFLILKPTAEAQATPITIALNWTSLLEKGK